MKQLDQQTFLNDITKHEMKVLRDDGLYRHLSFRQPGEYSWNMWFDLVTWPGNLVIRGDMGTWVFNRVEDMFTFFRREELGVNASYWAEKCESVDRSVGPMRKFSHEAFKASVLCHLENYDLKETDKCLVIQALEDDVFCEEYEHPVREALENFRFGEFRFTDTWEIEGKDWSYHFLWCLYAIVWGIQQYDTWHRPVRRLSKPERTRIEGIDYPIGGTP